MIINNFVKYAVLCIGMLLLMFPEVAFAAGPFTPSDGDKSKEIFIDYLFGPISGGGGSNPLGSIIEAFNKSILFIGGILVAYTLIAGTMSTAHDGEVLGKKWSSMWVPIRTAVGAASIFPVLPGGFCFAQAVVVWLAIQGVGLADNLVNKFLDSDHLAGNVLYEPPSIQRPIRAFLENVLVSNTCSHAIKGSVATNDDPTNNGFGLTDYVSGVATGTGANFMLHYGVVNQIGTQIALCGTITLIEPKSVDGMGGDNAATIKSLFNSDKFSQQLTETHKAEFMTAQDTLSQLGLTIAQGDSPELQDNVTKTLDALALKWSNAVREKAKSIMEENTNKEVIELIKNDGWLLLGAWYLEIAKAQDAVTKGVTTVPNGTMPAVIRAQNEDDGWITKVGKKLTNALNTVGSDAVLTQESLAAINRSMRYVVNTGNGPGGAVQNLSDTSTSTWTAKIVSWFINSDEGFYGTNVGTNMRANPVIMARNLGQNMTLAGWSGYGLAAGASVVAGGGLTGIGAMISPMVTAIAGTIIVSGATLSSYIPMLPYILWIGVALGWAILLIEAVIAAPLWAVTHLAPDGDGVVGRGGQGYMLVLSLTLRPALMVIGFAAAVTLMNPLGLLINSTFMGAFLTGVNPSIFGLTQMIMGCVLYTVVMTSVITRVFGLIHVIPDRILRWIGGGGSNDLGQEAHGIESNTAAKVMAGAHVSQTIGRGFADGAQHMRSNKQGKDNEAAAKLGGAEQSLGNAQDRTRDAEAGLDRAHNNLESSPGDASAVQNVKDKQDEVTNANFSQAMAAAKVAEAGGNVKNATQGDKQAAREARDFLKEAKNADPQTPEAKSAFMQSQQSVSAGRSWGAPMSNAGVQSSLSDSRINRATGPTTPLGPNPTNPDPDSPGDGPGGGGPAGGGGSTPVQEDMFRGGDNSGGTSATGARARTPSNAKDGSSFRFNEDGTTTDLGSSRRSSGGAAPKKEG